MIHESVTISVGLLLAGSVGLLIFAWGLILWRPPKLHPLATASLQDRVVVGAVGLVTGVMGFGLYQLLMLQSMTDATDRLSRQSRQSQEATELLSEKTQQFLEPYTNLQQETHQQLRFLQESITQWIETSTVLLTPEQREHLEYQQLLTRLQRLEAVAP